MIRNISGALVILLAAAVAFGSDVDGKVKAVDAVARTISVTADGKDQQFSLAADCKVYTKGVAGRTVAFSEAAAGVKALAAGQTVSLSSEFVDGKDSAVRIKIMSGAEGGRPPAKGAVKKANPVVKTDPAKPTDKKPVAEDPTASSDVRGIVAGVDLRKGMIAVIGSDGKTGKYKVAKTASYFLITPSGKRTKIDAAPHGLADAIPGADVTLSFADAEKKTVSMIKINVPPPAPKKKK